MTTNLLNETVGILNNNNLTESDVKFVCNRTMWMTWEEFKKKADIEYNSGYGCEEINLNLKIVGENWWLERHEYDGSEWWELKSMPEKPETHSDFDFMY